MELKLNFKEKEFREIYENAYLSAQDELKKKVSLNKKIRNVLLIITAFTFFMTLADRHWIQWTIVFLIITLLVIVWNEMSKREVRKSIVQNQKEVDDFVTKIKSKTDVKYTWDQEIIQYYESGEITDTFEWKDLVYMDDKIDYFTVYFSNNKPRIMIPRIMAEDKEVLTKFENAINETLNSR